MHETPGLSREMITTLQKWGTASVKVGVRTKIAELRVTLQFFGPQGCGKTYERHKAAKMIEELLHGTILSSDVNEEDFYDFLVAELPDTAALAKLLQLLPLNHRLQILDD